MKENKLFTGGHKFRIEDLEHLQNSTLEVADAICKYVSKDNTEVIILTGCVTGALIGGRYPVSAGYIYYKDPASDIGKIYTVPAHSFILPPFSSTKWKFVDVVGESLSFDPLGNSGQGVVSGVQYAGFPDDPTGEVKYQDGSFHNVHTIHAAQIVTDGSGSTKSLTNSKRIHNLLGLTPKGGIIMYNGPINAFNNNGDGIISPTDSSYDCRGWILCDGSNISAPNLKGRFIVGLDPTDSDYNICHASTSTSKTVTLEKKNIPAHVHVINSQAAVFPLVEVTDTSNPSLGGDTVIGSTNYNASSTTYHVPNRLTIPAHDHGGGTGDGTTDGLKTTPDAIDIRPSYYVLAFIMKA